jgi:hypothetical protein
MTPQPTPDQRGTQVSADLFAAQTQAVDAQTDARAKQLEIDELLSQHIGATQTVEAQVFTLAMVEATAKADEVAHIPTVAAIAAFQNDTAKVNATEAQAIRDNDAAAPTQTAAAIMAKNEPYRQAVGFALSGSVALAVLCLSFLALVLAFRNFDELQRRKNEPVETPSHDGLLPIPPAPKLPTVEQTISDKKIVTHAHGATIPCTAGEWDKFVRAHLAGKPLYDKDWSAEVFTVWDYSGVRVTLHGYGWIEGGYASGDLHLTEDGEEVFIQYANDGKLDGYYFMEA